MQENSKVFVWGNAIALEEALLNLLKNAIRHTPQEGEIHIGLQLRPHRMVALTIRDSGIGIAEKDLPHIFKAFYKGENTFGQGHSDYNVGLGLAIVKEIVALHRGKILVQSKKNHGTIFEIRLPVANS